MFLRGIEHSKVVTRSLSISCSGCDTLMCRMHFLLGGLGWSRLLAEDRIVGLLLTVRLRQSSSINLFSQ